MAPAGIIGAPASESEENIQAARLATFRIEKDSCWNNIWFADPAILGHYPEEGLRIYNDIMPQFSRSDLDQICQPLDFYGTNIYTADLIAADNSKPKFKTLPLPPGCPVTAMDWPLVPESLYWGVRFLNERYQLPVVITENGMAGHDWPCLDQRIHDQHRIDYMSRYLMQLARACAEGYQCPGYFYWSLLDNFEWAFGYSRRFGLIYVDYSTFKRTMKDSARWYAGLISSNSLDCRGKF